MASLYIFLHLFASTKLCLGSLQEEEKEYLVPGRKSNLKEEGLARKARFSHRVSGSFRDSVRTVVVASLVTVTPIEECGPRQDGSVGRGSLESNISYAGEITGKKLCSPGTMQSL